MASVVEILNTKGIEAINSIRNNLASTGTNATSKTSQSLQVSINQVGTKVTLQITGRPFFMTVETGRKPTPDKKPSRQMISNIVAWMSARGLDETKAWAVAMAINNKGSALWRKGGRKDIVSDVIDDDFYSSIENDILDQYGKDFLDRFLSDFKNVKNVRISS